MHRPEPQGKSVFRTPWFEVFADDTSGSPEPHYSIHAPDFVVVVALTTEGHLLMVRQFRPAVGAVTLELPAGHVDPGETPEQSARKELYEETGYDAATLELIATLSPSTARFTNRLWCFFARDATRRPQAVIERGMEPVIYTRGLAALLEEKDFYSTGSSAALFAAVARGRLPL